MTAWTKVVTEPLGLAGFALFLFFSWLAKNRYKKKPSWLAPMAVVMAMVGLGGGLTLAYLRVSHSSPESPVQQIGTIQQNSQGNESANVAGVQGSVSVNQNQPNSDTSASKPLTEKEVIQLLSGGGPGEKAIALIQKRGVDFEMTPDRAKKFRQAGASKAVIEALKKSQRR